MESVPRHLRFDTALWAMPWILRDDPEIRRILLDTDDPVEVALLRSAIDPGGQAIKRFVSQVKPFLNPNGKVFLITSEFIPNDIILAHTRDEGFEVDLETFAQDVSVVKRPEISLDLCQIELTRP